VGVHALQEQIFLCSPSSLAEGDIKAIPAKHTYVKYDVKIINKHFAGISRTFYISKETIRRPLPIS
jgi:hypothetical protein